MTACHICGSPKLEPLIQKGTPFRLVSSDVQPVVGTAEYSLCSNCLAVQKTATPAWQGMAVEEGRACIYELDLASGASRTITFSVTVD